MTLPYKNVTPPRLRKPGRRETVAARQHEALTFRKAGAHYRQIAEKLGVSHMQAHRDVRAALRTLAEETRATAGEFVALELGRLDSLLLGCWRNAMNGDVPSVLAALRVCESRRRLLGLDADAAFVAAAAETGDDLSSVPFAALRARLTRALGALAPAPTPGPPIDIKALEALEAGPVGVPLPVPDHGSREARLLAYETELRARREGGRPH